MHFASSYETEEIRMNELRGWLRACNYPNAVIKKGIHNARLQGPAPFKEPTHTIPFISTHTVVVIMTVENLPSSVTNGSKMSTIND